MYRGIVHADDARRALSLAILLGMARAVRRRTPSPVLGFEATLHDDGLGLTLRGVSGLDSEIYALERQQRRFESVFKTPLTLRADDHSLR
jgi:hypothetical protein